MSLQPNLFDLPEPTPRDLPAGLAYIPALLLPDEEAGLVSNLKTLPFAPVVFQGYQAQRREVSFGWSYDFDRHRVTPAPPAPAYLNQLRDRAAARFKRRAEAFEQVLVLEYAPGAAMGWHRDRPEFDEIIGLSLGAAAPFRFRRPAARGWERARLTLSPGSAYLITGPARTEWQHSIPTVEALRYSITFRSPKRWRA